MAPMIKSVFTAYTEEGEGEREAALGYALSLAQQAGAHLTVQAAAMRYNIPGTLIGDFGTAFVAAENRRITSLAKRFAELARTSAGLAGVTSTVETPELVYAELGGRLAGQARVHDLSVLDLEKDAAERDRGLIEAALFDSGRPVIIVPPEVEILSVTGEKDLSKYVAGAELAPHLSRHGAAVSVRNVALSAGQDVAEAIRMAAAEFDADLIVCGAYKHSRLREWILGGVTQSLLKSSSRPLLMSH